MNFNSKKDLPKRATNRLMLSTLVAGLLAISGTASAASQPKAAPTAQANSEQAVAEAEKDTAKVENTLQQQVEDEDGELLATQPGQVAVAEQTTADVTEEAGEDAEQTAEADAQPAPANINVTRTLAGEAGDNIEATPITLQEKVKDKRGELQATQPGQVEVQENRRFRAQ